MRAQEIEDRLMIEMGKENVAADRVFFDKRYVVEGDYNEDPENTAKYREYQYVRVWIYSCPYYNKKINE